MEGAFWPAFGLTLLAGLSTAFGAVVVFFNHGFNPRVLSVGLGFSAGVMIYVSFVEILRKSGEAFGAFWGENLGDAAAVACFFAGFALAFAIDQFIPKDINPHEPQRSDVGAHPDRASAWALKRTGIFVALALAIHNFPEGFATFAAALADPMLGLPIALAIAIHNIPEGLAVALPIYHATGSRWKAFMLGSASGLAEPIGALLGFALLGTTLPPLTLGVVFGAIAGIMVFISFDELIPSARAYGRGHSAIAGLAMGMAVMAASLVLLKLGA